MAMSCCFAHATARSKKREVRDGAGRVVRVVQPQQLRAGGVGGGHLVEAWQPAVLLAQRERKRVAAREHRRDLVHGVAGRRADREIAGVDEAQRQVPDALLRADQRDHLGLRVERHAVAALIPARDGFTELRQALALRVAVVGRVLGRALQRFDDVRRGRQVRVADAERDDIDAPGALLGDEFGDAGEEVRGELLDARR